MVGMFFAFIAVISQQILVLIVDETYEIGIIIGSFLFLLIPAAFIGIFIAARVQMTSMPQLVAGFHSLVGIAAVLISFAHWVNEFYEIKIALGKNPSKEAIENYRARQWAMHLMRSLEYILGVFIGGLTFVGSIVAMGKLQGIIKSTPLIIGGNLRHFINLLVITVSVLCFVPFLIFFVSEDYLALYINTSLLVLVTLLSFFIGWHLVMAIGGADMPVVVSMLNSYSGMATAAVGFLLYNYAMIVGGALIASSGAILSYIMCEAMNRSFMNVILGGFGVPSTMVAVQGEPVLINATELAQLLSQSNYITIVPGYGMAVAKAQHVIAEMTDMLTNKMNKKVIFIIHPVAGRLPGHMNVLLAEANVSYKIVKSMEEVTDIKDCDVSMVIGANDIVNPIAQTDPNCSLAGMPIIESYRAKVCVINKRSLAQGYAAVDNPLFFYPNTKMFLKDAKVAFEELNVELKKLLTRPVKTTGEEIGGDETTSLLIKDKQDEEEQTLKTLQEHVYIGVLKENDPEQMVAMVPSVAKQLRNKGYGLFIEQGCGLASCAEDGDYIRVGCRITTREQIFKDSHIILKVRPPTTDELDEMQEGQICISFFYPSRNPNLVQKAAQKRVTIVAMDRVPRITIAQAFDALSSTTNLSGYRSIVEACNLFGRTLSGQVTSAGKSPPAQVFVIGCGVAGLSAIRTAKGLGAIVKAHDVRKASQEQAESVGAEYVALDIDLEDGTAYAKTASEDILLMQKNLFRTILPETDIVITTANVPGNKSPIFITRDMLDHMKVGSVVVDLAAENGGNCEVTKRDTVYMYNDRVHIVGTVNLLLKMVPQASFFYAQNMLNLLNFICKSAAEFRIDTSTNEVMRQMVVTENGDIPEPHNMQVVAPPSAPKKEEIDVVHRPKKSSFWLTLGVLVFMCVLMLFMMFLPDEFVQAVLSFVLAVIVGYYVVWSVTSALHTPLMSVTNAISGIIAVSAISNVKFFESGLEVVDLELKHFQSTEDIVFTSVASAIGGVAFFLASLNIFGGFYITYRMLKMFIR